MKKRSLIFGLVGLFSMTLVNTGFAYSPDLRGKPDEFRAGHDRGYYIWQDYEGVHIRTTTKGQSHVFSGKLHTDGRFAEVHGVRLEDEDKYHVGSAGHKLDFTFDTTAGTDGIDFRIEDGEKIKFDLFIDGHKISPKEIHLGGDSSHPENNKFKIEI